MYAPTIYSYSMYKAWRNSFHQEPAGPLRGRLEHVAFVLEKSAGGEIPRRLRSNIGVENGHKRAQKALDIYLQNVIKGINASMVDLSENPWSSISEPFAFFLLKRLSLNSHTYWWHSLNLGVPRGLNI